MIRFTTIKIKFIKDLFKTAIDFLRLEKVEIGGTRGKNLGAKTSKMFEEFREEFEKFAAKRYNPLDPKCDVILKKSTIT